MEHYLINQLLLVAWIFCTILTSWKVAILLNSTLWSLWCTSISSNQWISATELLAPTIWSLQALASKASPPTTTICFSTLLFSQPPDLAQVHYILSDTNMTAKTTVTWFVRKHITCLWRKISIIELTAYLTMLFGSMILSTPIANVWSGMCINWCFCTPLVQIGPITGMCTNLNCNFHRISLCTWYHRCQSTSYPTTINLFYLVSYQ